MSSDGYLPDGCTHRDVDVHFGGITIISVECSTCGEPNDPLDRYCVECGEDRNPKGRS
ncbi:MAG: hypothetical protein PVH29_06110 [Candidatus Zixiibacteriota bacterium]|jgi:hypothetical protein